MKLFSVVIIKEETGISYEDSCRVEPHHMCSNDEQTGLAWRKIAKLKCHIALATGTR